MAGKDSLQVQIVSTQYTLFFNVTNKWQVITETFIKRDTADCHYSDRNLFRIFFQFEYDISKPNTVVLM